MLIVSRISRMLLGAAMVLFIFTGPATAQAPTVTVEVAPKTVQLVPDREARAEVVLRNTSGETVSDVRVSWFTGASLTVRSEGQPADVLGPYGQSAVTLWLTQDGAEPVSDAVQLRVDYSWRRTGGEPVPQILLSSFEVKSPARESIAQVATVEVKTTLESLSEKRPGKVYLAITDVAGVPVHVKSVEPGGPSFIKFGPPDQQDFDLKPRETRVVAIEVSTADAVQPGKQLLLFQVVLEWGKGETAKMVQTSTVDVGVFGESAIVQALGLPSFLLLPGFLLLTVMGLLWKISKSKEQPDFPFELKSPEFWAVAISVSMVVAFLYPVVTGRLYGSPRNYLESYGFFDVVLVWGASVALGIVLWFLLFLVVRAGRAWKQLPIPSTKDKPWTILRKLHRQGLGIVLKQAVVAVQGRDINAFLIEKLNVDNKYIWVAPGMTLKWKPAATVELKDQVDALFGKKDSQGALDLADLVEQGRKEGKLDVIWNEGEGLSGPYQVKTESVKFASTGRIIKEEV